MVVVKAFFDNSEDSRDEERYFPYWLMEVRKKVTFLLKINQTSFGGEANMKTVFLAHKIKASSLQLFISSLFPYLVSNCPTQLTQQTYWRLTSLFELQ